MRLSRFFLPLLVVTVGAGLYLLTVDDDAPQARPPAAATPGEGGSPSQPAAGAPSATEPAADSAPQVREVLRSGGDGEAQASGPRVLVVERASARPVPGARVTFMPYAAGDLGEAIMPTPWQTLSRLGRLAQARGRHFTTAAGGIVRIPATGGRPFVLVASSAKGWAIRKVDEPGGETIRLELEPDLCLCIKVVDSEGRPLAGMPVGVRGKMGFFPTTEARARTAAPDGVARLEHLQLMGTLTDKAGNPGRVEAILDCLLATPVTRPVDLNNLPAEPVELTMPAVGALELQVREGEEPVGEGTFLASLVAMAPGPKGRLRPQMMKPGNTGLLPVVGGRVVFAPVGVGIKLQARLFRLFPGRQSSRLPRSRPEYFVISGPAEAGERTTAVVTVAQPPPILAGRALDEKGRPLAQRVLRWRLELNGAVRPFARNRFHQVRTDGKGMFTVQLSSTLTGEGSRVLCLASGPPEQPDRLGRIDISRPVATGTLAVGDLVLIPPRYVAAGRVVDDRGRPLVGAEIRVELPGNGGKAPFSMGAGSPEGWRIRGDVTGRTGEDGGFALPGAITVDRIRVQARCQGHLPCPPESTAAGVTDLVLTLPRAGGLAGTLLLPTSPRLSAKGAISFHRPSPLRILVTCRERPEEKLKFSLKGTDGLHCAPLSPGTADLSIVLSGDPDNPLVTIKGLEIRPGEINRDPRLQGLDLRRTYHVLRIQVEKPGSGPVAPAVVSGPSVMGNLVGFALGPEFKDWQMILGAEFLIHTRTLPVDLRIQCHGCRSCLVQGVTGDRKVTIEPGIAVAIKLPAGFRLPPGAEAIQVRCTLAGGKKSGPPMPGLSQVPLDPGGRARLSLPRAGRYELTWRLVAKGAKGYPLVPVPGGGKVITVEDREEEQLFTAGPGLQAMAEALEGAAAGDSR